MKLDMSRAWNEATEMFKANREVMMVIAGVFFFLPSFAAVLLMPQMQPPVGSDEKAISEYLLAFYADNAPVLVLIGLAQLIGFIALQALLRDDSKPTVGDALKTGALGLLPYIGVQLLLALGLMLGIGILVGIPSALGLPMVAVGLMLLALVPIVYAGTKLSLVTAVIAIEKLMNPITIIRRSWQLTKGNSLRLFLFYLLLMVVFLVGTIVISSIVGLVVALLGNGTASLVANGIVSGLMSAGATMLFAAVIAAVHRQLAGPSTGQLSQTFD